MFPNNTYGRITVDIEGTLTVTDVTKEDEGFYVCSALSALGSITARAHLEISTLGDTPPPLISVLPVNQTVPEGESVTVHCKAEPASAGSSAPNIRWLFNEKEIDEEDDDRITVEDTSLTIQGMLKRTRVRDSQYILCSWHLMEGFDLTCSIWRLLDVFGL